ncbi:MarR family winged helix-turn-helix transcriptional regulator [Montanilutibacter psychrotolerans]|uniref:MarR family transcriptional regulator n=1 Tax=Montanilutibacter psychrotolerans TaxID=1327343 RepID=A0A3M8T2X4_9GAMM|nr:MarR family transcriptional regulator [Lysobacter psychrotolerans]RNF85112.1 MarR family transcriptional regulator [Lysobacter psychrotolerans]
MNTQPPVSATCGGSSLALLLREIRAAFWSQMEGELAAAGHDLNFSQYITLKRLSEGEASVTDLARVAQLNPGAMTRLLDKLQAKGIVTRLANPADRRALHIHLTDAGVAIWNDIHHCGQRIRELATAGMSDADRDQLARLLTQVRDNLTSSGS